MKKIVKNQIVCLQDLLKGKEIIIDLDIESLNWLSSEGHSKTYGARPVKRLIQQKIQNPISKLILENKLKKGNSLKISLHFGDLKFNIA